jgi:hypothetical protein
MKAILATHIDFIVVINGCKNDDLTTYDYFTV